MKIEERLMGKTIRGFHWEAPEGWEALSHEVDGILVSMALGPVADGFRNNVNVVVETVEEEMSMETYISALILNLHIPTGVAPIKGTPKILDISEDSAHIRVSRNVAGILVIQNLMVTKRNNAFVVVTLSENYTQQDPGLNVLTRASSSVQIIPNLYVVR
ncbi:MAG: hypothetical protein ACR2MS_07655 [Weeksellaceae bacterium]